MQIVGGYGISFLIFYFYNTQISDKRVRYFLRISVSPSRIGSMSCSTRSSAAT